MSQARRITPRDDETAATAEVPLKVLDAINRIGTAVGVRLPIPNDVVAAAAQKFYVAKHIKSAAETRHEAARDALLAVVSVPDVAGEHIAHDSSVAIVTINNRKQARRLNRDLLATAIVRHFNVDLGEALRVIDEGTIQETGYQRYINVVLK